MKKLLTAVIVENAEKANPPGSSAIPAVKRFRRPHERGFALLLVFLMAALIAVALYREVPRVSFEAQRSKEELLIERGEQYKRAIQIFVRQNNNRYPQKIEDLENFNNRRYLRKRYKDPITGSDEWRLIHIGPGGMFTDSLTQKPPQAPKSGFGTSVEDIAKEQQGQQDASARPAPWQRVRPSEGGQPYPPGQEPPAGTEEEEEAPQPPAYAPPVPQPAEQVENVGEETGQPPVPGQPFIPGQPVPGQPLQPGQNPEGPTVVQPPVFPWQRPAGQPGQPSIVQPGQPQPGWRPDIGRPGLPAMMPGQPGWRPGMVQSGEPPAPQTAPPGSEAPGMAGPGFQAGSNRPPFFSPRPPQTAPPPASGSGPSQFGVPAPVTGQLFNPTGGFGSGQNRNMTIGGGIAGVASKSEDPGIKVYNERTKYNEWEFIYDPRKDRTNPMSAVGQGIPQGPGGPQPNFPGNPPNPGPKK